MSARITATSTISTDTMVYDSQSVQMTDPRFESGEQFLSVVLSEPRKDGMVSKTLSWNMTVQVFASLLPSPHRSMSAPLGKSRRYPHAHESPLLLMVDFVSIADQFAWVREAGVGYSAHLQGFRVDPRLSHGTCPN
jgi:hypothetical protein